MARRRAESVASEIEACEDWPWHDGPIIEMATEIVGQIKSLVLEG